MNITKYVIRLGLLQILVTLIAGLLGLILSSDVALAIVTGGMIALLSQAFCSLRYVIGKKHTPELALQGLYRAQTTKFVISSILFALTFSALSWAKVPANALSIMISYLTVVSLGWWLPLMINISIILNLEK